MTTKSAALASIVACALAGCSVIFDMQDYEPRSAAASDGGTSSSGGSSGSSGRLEDGAIVDGPGGNGNDDGGIIADAADDRTPLDCTMEDEPNNDEVDANDLLIGENCGSLSSQGDVDYFVFTTTTNTTLKLSLPPSVRYELIPEGSSTPTQTFSGGGGTTSVGPGTYFIRLSRIAGPTVPPAYELNRLN